MATMLTHDTLDAVLVEARERGASALWTATNRSSPEPAPSAIPFVWKYAELRALLLRAADLISAEESQRRVLRLDNPGLASGRTTDTLFAGLQCILSGERAPSHRHTPFALRLVLEGNGAYTSVDGERLWMEPGDLILTPSWSYHDHGKIGDGPMIWLDGLDTPLFRFMGIGFQEKWAAASETLTDAAPDTNLRFPWIEMRARLDAEPGSYATLPYLDRYTGSQIGKTIGARAERLSGGVRSPRRRMTASNVFNVIAGRGRSIIGTTTLEWEPGDTFAVPAWYPHAHEALGTETAYLFSYSDRPMLESLGLYREDPAGP
jgi:gentisate 1,2-dioxygenase